MGSNGKENAEDIYTYLDIPKPSESDLQWPKQETFSEKFYRKTKENPLVPLGLGVTGVVLVCGLWTLKTGDKQRSQQLMRYRVGAQAFTVLSLLGGVLYQSYKMTPQKKT